VGGRLAETVGPTNRNRISRPTRRASWHNTAKPTGSAAEVNAAVVTGSNALLPGEAPYRATGAIVALKSVKADGAKGRTG